MRKVLFMAAACSVMGMVALSCGKENITPDASGTNPPDQPQGDEKVVTLSAGVEETKVFSSGNTLKWNGTADKLAVFADVSGNIVKYQFEKAAGSSATSAEFTGSVAATAVLKYASYAYSEGRTCEDDVLGLNLGDQGCDATNSIPHNTPLYGVISGTSVTMKTPCAFLKVMLPKTTGDETLSIYDKVSVSAEDAFGNFTVDCSGETPVVSAGDRSSINITPKNSQSGYVYVPILPGTYDDITITIDYNDSHADFSRNSTETQTFVSGYAYDCHEVAGPYVESVTTGAGTVVETTLSMGASAVLWKYAGVTNSDYTCKFFYAAHGTDKGDPGWTEVAASSVTGDGTAVTFSATATVAAGAYDFYAQVSDGSVTIDGDVEAAVVKIRTDVTFDFSNAGVRAGSPYSVEEYTGGRSDNDRLITDDQGNVVAPAFSPSNGKATYYYKPFSSATTEYGAVASVATGNPPAGQVGITVHRGDFSIVFPRTSKFYTFSSDMLCFSVSSQYFVVNCPAGYTIKKVRLQCPANKTCTWGIGTTWNGFEISAAIDYKDVSEAVDVEIPITSLNAGQKCYIASGASNNRLGSIVITYEN